MHFGLGPATQPNGCLHSAHHCYRNTLTQCTSKARLPLPAMSGSDWDNEMPHIPSFNAAMISSLRNAAMITPSGLSPQGS